MANPPSALCSHEEKVACSGQLSAEKHEQSAPGVQASGSGAQTDELPQQGPSTLVWQYSTPSLQK